MCSIRIFAKNMDDPYYEPTIVVHEMEVYYYFDSNKPWPLFYDFFVVYKSNGLLKFQHIAIDGKTSKSINLYSDYW